MSLRGLGAALLVAAVAWAYRAAVWDPLDAAGASERVAVPLACGASVNLLLQRDASSGALRVRAEAEAEAGLPAEVVMAAGQGVAHCRDRYAQMLVQRTAAQGRLGELLAASDATAKADDFLRDAGIRGKAEALVRRLGPETKRALDAYAAGVRACAAAASSLPAELVALRVPEPEPWAAADSVATSMLVAYVGMATLQTDFEKLLLRAVRDGAWEAAAPDEAAALFGEAAAAALRDDPETVAALRDPRLVLLRPPLPEDLLVAGVPPPVVASNNWAVAGRHTASGAALQANDPHLQVNRLPAVFAETVHERPGGGFAMGASLPGVPGLLMGRNARVSYGFTYGMADTLDLTVEEVRGGLVRRPGGEWSDEISVRVERVAGAGGAVRELRFYSTRNGQLELPPADNAPPADGLYLARRWSWDLVGDRAFAALLSAPVACADAEGCARVLRDTPVTANFVIGDARGSVAYQQAGAVPDREAPAAAGGLLPRLGWREGGGWRGLVPPERLRSELNPARGFVATANEGRLPGGGGGQSPFLSIDAGHYRRDRATELLEALVASGRPVTAEDMQAMQADTLCTRARGYLGLLRERGALEGLPPGPAADALLAWDLRYEPDSRGATVWAAALERAAAALMGRVIGAGAWEAVRWRSALYGVLAERVDGLLRAPARAALLREAVHGAVRELNGGEGPPVWGERQQVTLLNVVFAGRLPRFVGFDSGPHPLPGSHSTLSQGSVTVRNGALVALGPLWRYVCDLGTRSMRTSLFGGPSGRRFSRWYESGVEPFLAHKYYSVTAA